jgi:hypothetical protein
LYMRTTISALALYHCNSCLESLSDIITGDRARESAHSDALQHVARWGVATLSTLVNLL